MSKSMLIAQSILTSGPGQLTLYDCQTTAKNRKVSFNTSDGTAGSSRQGDMCMFKECSSTNEDHEVGLHSSHEASETSEAEGSYSMISCDLDSSCTMNPSQLNTMIPSQPLCDQFRYKLVATLFIVCRTSTVYIKSSVTKMYLNCTDTMASFAILRGPSATLIL